MSFSGLKVRTRLAFGFGTILVFVAVITGVGLFGMMRENDALHEVVNVNVKKMALLEDMSSSVHIISRVIRTIALLDEDPANRSLAERQKEQIADSRKRYDSAFESLRNMRLDQHGKEFVQSIDREKAVARKLNDEFLLLERTDKPAAIRFLIEKVNPAVANWQDGIHELFFCSVKKTPKFQR